jgi:hypothetical protein
MKKIIVSTIACCALIAPLAFAKDPNGKSSKHVRAVHVAFLTQQQGVTVTAPGTSNRSEQCMAADYQPAKTLIIHKDGPSRYVLEGPSHVFNRKGEVVRSAIRPGTPLRVYYTADDAGRQTIDHVVVD